ncbi:hypothetical protein [Arenimonas sp.]|uniref:hypothetical protein n=1 Tax=Arenimonas sp. TaxID=1872635 RepID=UPI0039E2F9ED
MRRFELPLTWQTLLSLSLLCWVASFSHEVTHHVAGWLVCGEVGRMSLNRFVLDASCTGPWPLSTAAGPALSYLMMWLGAWMVWRGKRPLVGFAMVVAYIPFLRLLTAAMGGGDEGVLMRLAFPDSGHWPALALVLALSLPPLIVCFRALANRRRIAVFFAAFLIPLIPLLPIPSRDGVWYGEWLAGNQMLPNLFGVPWSVWAAHLTMAMLCLCALLLLFPRAPALVSPARTLNPIR